MNQLFRQLLGGAADTPPTGQRATHTHVIGQPGTGKSRALESWIMQDITAGRGVGVIDPHGDLYRNLLARIAARQAVWDRVVTVDPCNPKWTVSFNPLEAAGDLSQERLALFLTDVVIKIWRLDMSSSPRLIWLLTNTFLALSSLGLTLIDLPRFLLDEAFREGLLPQLAHETARAYFLYEFPQSRGAVHQWVTPVLNKIGNLIFDPDIRLILAGGTRLDFREVLDRKLILLVNLPKGILGEGASALLGAFIVAHLQKAALSRADSIIRPLYYLYLDEFQNYTTDNIKDILSESRKYSLSLILAHQYLDQLSSDLRSAVLNTAGTLVCFRVGYGDAYRLAHEVFPSPDFLTTAEHEVRLGRFGSWPVLSVDEQRKPLGWDGLAQVLTESPPRVFWSRQRGRNAPTKQRTFDMPTPVRTHELKASIRDLLNASGLRYGRLKEDVRRELGGVPIRVVDLYPEPDPLSRTVADVEDVPLWSD